MTGRPYESSGLDRSPVRVVKTQLERGPLPHGDGWGGLYRLFDKLGPPGSAPRRVLCRYFWPKGPELATNAKMYRYLGVPLFGRIIPTGGVAIRRLTGAKMAPYTLRGTSIGAARDFYYRTCAFEAAHSPFMLALLVLTGYQLANGRFDLAANDMLVNLGVNIYPIMHHRHTRVRITNILAAAQRSD